ncbi:MAG TPA: hypothetical protein VFY32_17860 [Solirubrobacteraceae bacterium]|jgi:hypothetical protein|nr:hypothetical protein [Solirubrobacteraceae bacterium]
MSFDVSPLGGTPYAASPLDRTQRASDGSQASFPRIGSPSAPPIPTEVWDQVDDAARLAESLTADGRQVRFDVHKLDGSVVASLVDESGGLLRPLLLKDVVDVNRLSNELDKEQ